MLSLTPVWWTLSSTNIHVNVTLFVDDLLGDSDKISSKVSPPRTGRHAVHSARQAVCEIYLRYSPLAARCSWSVRCTHVNCQHDEADGVAGVDGGAGDGVSDR